MSKGSKNTGVRGPSVLLVAGAANRERVLVHVKAAIPHHIYGSRYAT